MAQKYVFYFAYLCTAFCVKVNAQDPGTFEVLTASTRPAVVSEGQAFEIVLGGYNLDFIAGSDGVLQRPPNVEVDGGVISISTDRGGCFLVPGILPNDSPTKIILPLEGLPAGSYALDITIHNGCWGPATYAGEITVFPNAETPVFYHETPASGQVVSGVGVIRGWACFPRGRGEIGTITFTLNDAAFRVPLPYGSLREDTTSVCFFPGSRDIANTGYGGVFYWGGFPDGEYTMTLFMDGEEFDSVDFFVAQPPATDVPEDRGFRKGSQGEYIVDNFLGTDETVTIRWSQADQNFIIVSYD